MRRKADRCKGLLVGIVPFGSGGYVGRQYAPAEAHIV